jgi:hypothetical protein
MSVIRIEPFRPELTPEASRVLARAFVTNPVHVVAFGPGQLSRNEAFFRTGLAAMKGPKVVALEGSQIVGLLHSVDSSDCQFSGPEKLRMTPAMIGGFGLGSALRVSCRHGRSMTRADRIRISGRSASSPAPRGDASASA